MPCYCYGQRIAAGFEPSPAVEVVTTVDFVQLHRVAISRPIRTIGHYRRHDGHRRPPGGRSTKARLLNEEFGDSNIYRDQGQVLIRGQLDSRLMRIRHSRRCRARDAAGTNLPHPGAVRNLQDFNTSTADAQCDHHQQPVSLTTAPAEFCSAATRGSIPAGAVPFGRIVNNTIFGGIRRPDRHQGQRERQSDASEQRRGQSAHRHSGRRQLGQRRSSAARCIIATPTEHVGTGDGTFPIVMSGGEPSCLSIRPTAISIRSPARRLIDSSIDSLQDRPEMTTLMNPLGFAPSPIRRRIEISLASCASTIRRCLRRRVWAPMFSRIAAPWTGPTSRVPAPR